MAKEFVIHTSSEEEEKILKLKKTETDANKMRLRVQIPEALPNAARRTIWWPSTLSRAFTTSWSILWSEDRKEGAF